MHWIAVLCGKYIILNPYYNTANKKPIKVLVLIYQSIGWFHLNTSNSLLVMTEDTFCEMVNVTWMIRSFLWFYLYAKR